MRAVRCRLGGRGETRKVYLVSKCVVAVADSVESRRKSSQGQMTGEVKATSSRERVKR